MAVGPSITATLCNRFIVVTWSVPFETFCEEDNEHDNYANCLTVVGHIPREITCTCHCFIKNKGEITGEVKDNSAAQQLMEV